jgi:hypothetical protein
MAGENNGSLQRRGEKWRNVANSIGRKAYHQWRLGGGASAANVAKYKAASRNQLAGETKSKSGVNNGGVKNIIRHRHQRKAEK